MGMAGCTPGDFVADSLILPGHCFQIDPNNENCRPRRVEAQG
jgi:hypothetical protein